VAERARARRSAPSGAPALQAIRGLGKSSATNRLIQERLRLAIVSALAINEKLSFSELRQILDTTDGNLSVHARKLEEAGYVECSKYFAHRVPRTDYRLTAKGRQALMEALVRAMRQ